MGVKRSDYIKEAVVSQNAYIADLIGLDEAMPSGSTNAIDNLLGTSAPKREESKTSSSAITDLLEVD